MKIPTRNVRFKDSYDRYLVIIQLHSNYSVLRSIELHLAIGLSTQNKLQNKLNIAKTVLSYAYCAVNACNTGQTTV